MDLVIFSIFGIFLFIIAIGFMGERDGQKIEKNHLRDKINNALKDARVLMNGEHILAAKVTFKDGKPDVDSIEFSKMNEMK